MESFSFIEGKKTRKPDRRRKEEKSSRARQIEAEKAFFRTSVVCITQKLRNFVAYISYNGR